MKYLLIFLLFSFFINIAEAQGIKISALPNYTSDNSLGEFPMSLSGTTYKVQGGLIGVNDVYTRGDSLFKKRLGQEVLVSVLGNSEGGGSYQLPYNGNTQDYLAGDTAFHHLSDVPVSTFTNDANYVNQTALNDSAAAIRADFPAASSGSTNSNIGSGYRWAVPNTNNIKTLFNRYGLLFDSTTNTNGISAYVDTSLLLTKLGAAAIYGTKFYLAATSPITLTQNGDTLNIGIPQANSVQDGYLSSTDYNRIGAKGVAYYRKNATRDSTVLVLNDSTRYAVKDSVGTGGGSGWNLTGNTLLNRSTNYLGSSDTSQVHFKTKATDAIVIDSNQRVGIGTASPSQKLEVSGSLSSTNTSVYTRVADAAHTGDIKMGVFYLNAYGDLPGIWMSQSLPGISNYTFMQDVNGDNLFNTTSASKFRVNNSDRMTVNTSSVTINGVPLNVINGSITSAGRVAATTNASTNTTLIYNQEIVIVDATTGAVTITLPTAIGHTGQIFTIKKYDNVNNVTISGSQTIDGAASVVLTTQNQFITVVSSGAAWFIIAQK